ncbi:hypothetical protein CAPTEDRAFT_109345 [Capitella teleta]|uniref:Sulfatase N-terminal domain-containing protein n=1 Tax=Capitella teleta TaxID=283909 RepID=R7U848_CAPTE|nr:hypothetical protein CAPTEDRAFT_109345 [Capitella teleta]|eukprot:ELU02545.1 hypothetical protein CAPTEDRAFT_109345 [Capitella teleta]
MFLKPVFIPGYHDLGFRNPDVITPNIDALATEGVIFTNNYVQSVCTPSRHALLTGRYPHRSAMQNLVIMSNQARCTGLGYKFLPEYLKDLGYSTHAVGKWHVGYCREECLPTHRGFDSFFGLYDGDGYYWNHTSTVIPGAFDWNNSTGVYLEARGIHSEDLGAERLTAILDGQNAKEPFFLYFSPQNPHTPSQPQAEFLNLYPENRYPDIRRKYLGLVSGLDRMVGGIVDGLKRNGLMNNTYIIFVSDNGADPEEGLNDPFRGGKGSLFEGGTKSASFIYSPLLNKAGYENNGLMHITDWMPTILKLAGGSIPEGEQLDGIDQSDMVKNGKASQRKKMVYSIDREADKFAPLTGEIAVRWVIHNAPPVLV